MQPTEPTLEISQEEWTQIHAEIETLKKERVEISKMEKWFALMTENVADLFAIVDARGQKSWKEVSGLSLTRFSPLVLEGAYAHEEVHPQDAEALTALFEDALSTGIGQRVRHRMRREPQGWVWLESQMRVVRDAQGVVEYLVLVGNEVGEHQKKELEQAKVRSSQAVSHFAKGLNLELQGRLNQLNKNLSGMKKAGQEKGKESGNGDENLKEASEAVAQIQELIQSLEGLTCEEPKKLEEVELNHLLEKMLEETAVAPSVKKSFQSLVKSAHVLGGREMLTKGFGSLFANAAEAVKEGGQIGVEIERIVLDFRSPNRPPQLSPREYLRVKVSDSGAGIKDGEGVKIFDPYYSTKQRKGLGLASALNIFSKHKGTLTVEGGEEGLAQREGGVFYVYLPAYAVNDGKKKSETRGEKKNHPKKIIFMDDEPLVRKFVTRLLVALGYEVTPAADGKEVVELYGHALAMGDPFDGVVMDLIIPQGMGGELAIQDLRKLDEKVVVVASSGQINNRVMLDPRAYGFAAAIAKPYNRERLGAVLASALGVKS
jgi:signal transduction histidine kinase/ActR/RegA family two-component response regulator